MPNTNSTPSKIKAKLGFHGVLDSQVVNALTVAYNALLHNPAFPNTPVDLAIYKAGIDTLATLVADAEDGGNKAIKAKDKQRVVMIRMYIRNSGTTPRARATMIRRSSAPAVLRPSRLLRRSRNR